MEKLQTELNKIISTNEFLQKIANYDIICLMIYPIYELLNLFDMEFITHFWKFYSFILLLFVIGILLVIANNKLQQLMMATGLVAILAVVDVLKGDVDNIVYAGIYGFIAYQAYKTLSASIDAGEQYNVCPQCGNSCDPTEKFCTICGQKLNDES